MGWLFRDITRQELIADRTASWERLTGDLLVQSSSLAHCVRGNVFSGILWGVWERKFLINEIESQPSERWITCDMIQCKRNEGWGYKDLSEADHPYFYSCPMSYLELVPIELYGGNASWRKDVIDHHQRQREKRKSRAIIV